MGKEKKQDRGRLRGKPPGTLSEKADKGAEGIRLDLINYSESFCNENRINLSELQQTGNLEGVKWLNVTGIENSEVLHRIGEVFHIHPLILEDIQHTDQRPKIEEHENYLYIVVKILWWEEQTRSVVPEQVSLIITDSMVISFQEAAGDTFDIIRNRLREKKGRVRSYGEDYLVYALIDSIIDHYFQVMEELEEQFDEAENSIFRGSEEEIPKVLYNFSLQLTEMRKAVQPLREVFLQLQKQELPYLTKTTKIFLKDAQDHVFILTDIHEALREKLNSLRNMHATNLSNKMNSIMKVLTVIATIFIPLTFIAGVYGMNFTYMPELAKPWAYPLVLGIMGALIIAMVIIFKRKKWI